MCVDGVCVQCVDDVDCPEPAPLFGRLPVRSAPSSSGEFGSTLIRTYVSGCVPAYATAWLIPWIVGVGNAIAALDSLEFSDDYRLTLDSAVAEGVAVWSTIDLPSDIDGDMRPNVDGMPDWAGADIPK